MSKFIDHFKSTLATAIEMTNMPAHYRSHLEQLSGDDAWMHIEAVVASVDGLAELLLGDPMLITFDKAFALVEQSPLVAGLLQRVNYANIIDEIRAANTVDELDKVSRQLAALYFIRMAAHTKQ